MTGPVEREERSYWVHPQGGKPCLCSHVCPSPPPLLGCLDLPYVGLSHPLHQGWLPHTELHNTAIYWQRQNAFLSGSKVWPLFFMHRDAGKPSTFSSILIKKKAVTNSTQEKSMILFILNKFNGRISCILC